MWSLRLGFSSKEASKIDALGIKEFLKQSFSSEFDKELPKCLHKAPKTLNEVKEYERKKYTISSEEKTLLYKEQNNTALELKKWWINKFRKEEFPLREKMVCFWHNHFVSSIEKVEVNYWIYQHNQILRENAFGNYKELTKKILKTNAMIKYLDNINNQKDKINENLSRELLECFSLGIGNYSEHDVKSGAKALAGLSYAEEFSSYDTKKEDNDEIEYLGRKGKFKLDDLIDIVFEQNNTPFFITKKILQWFLDDNPSERQISYYGNYFKKNNFEIKPLLTKIILTEFNKKKYGLKIKDPLLYILQLINELGINEISDEMIVLFLKQQGMDLFNQPNVRGWQGGNSWLSAENYFLRINIADLLCNEKNLNRKKNQPKNISSENQSDITAAQINLNLNWDRTKNNLQIISEISERLLFQVDKQTQNKMENILNSNFNPNVENASKNIIDLYKYIIKKPEFQIV